MRQSLFNTDVNRCPKHSFLVCMQWHETFATPPNESPNLLFLPLNILKKRIMTRNKNLKHFFRFARKKGAQTKKKCKFKAPDRPFFKQKYFRPTNLGSYIAYNIDEVFCEIQ